jgi:hypothetical protein
LDSSCCHSVPPTPKKFYIWDLICSKCRHVIKHTHTHSLSLSLSPLHIWILTCKSKTTVETPNAKVHTSTTTCPTPLYCQYASKHAKANYTWHIEWQKCTRCSAHASPLHFSAPCV